MLLTPGNLLRAKDMLLRSFAGAVRVGGGEKKSDLPQAQTAQLETQFIRPYSYSYSALWHSLNCSGPALA